MPEDITNVSTEEFLDEEDLYILRKISFIRENIGAFINNKLVNDLMVKIIDNTTIFNFKSERNRKYLINKGRPSYILKMNFLEASKKYNYKFLFTEKKDLYKADPLELMMDKSLSADHKKITDIIYNELIIPFNEALMDIILNDDKFYKVVEDAKIKVTEDIRNYLKAEGIEILGSIFYITDNLKENIIQLTYML